MPRRAPPLVYLAGPDPTAALTIDRAARRVYRATQPIHLSNHERRRLDALLNADRQYMPNPTLIQG